MTPKRIQRKRTKGWIMPPDTVYVGRNTKWGNPFRIGIDGDREKCVSLYQKFIESNLWTEPNKYSIQAELKGKNLACWCKEGEPCHADILLEIANQ